MFRSKGARGLGQRLGRVWVKGCAGFGVEPEFGSSPPSINSQLPN